ncbi:lipopolysaccharide assembly protein B [Abditibacteriota bacterium]|nr:lipopolysaccharide assembly protein B [Abditibacteriota bacterium]
MRFFGGLLRSDRNSLFLVTFLLCAGGFAVFSLWSNLRSAPVQEHITRGIEFLQNEQSAAAQSQGRAALQIDPHNSQAWELVGDALLQSRDPKEARVALERALQENPEEEGLREKLASCALATGDRKAAQRFAKDELTQNPKSVAALLLLANIAQEDGQSNQRVAYLQKATELQPENAQIVAQLVDELGRRQEYDKALPLAERLVSLEPSASSYYLRALARYTVSVTPNDIKRAKVDFEKVLELDPNSIEAHRFLGRIALRQNQPQVAIAEFEAVGRGRPYASAHLLELSRAYRRVGNEQKADQLQALFTHLNQFNTRVFDFKKAIELNPEKSENYLQLGELLTNGLESDESLYRLYLYRYINKKFQSVQYYLNEASRQRPQDQAVRVANQRAKKLYDKYLQMGLQELSHRDYQQASENIAHAVLLRPNDPRTQGALKQINAVGFDPLKIDSTPQDFSAAPGG